MLVLLLIAEVICEPLAELIFELLEELFIRAPLRLFWDVVTEEALIGRVKKTIIYPELRDM